MNTSKSTNDVPSLSKIDSVNSSVAQFHQTTGGMWLDFFKSINPLGTIADMYARTLVYKMEVKRLEAEEERIKQQAAIAHNVIDKTFELKMEELVQRKMALVGFYATFNNKLQDLRIEKQKVLQMAEESNKLFLRVDLPFEERRMYKEAALEFIKQVHEFNKQGHIELKEIRESLPKVDITNRLIEG